LTETKQISPKYVKAVQAIVDMRIKENNTFLFARDFPATGCAMENLMKDLNKEAAIVLGWPDSLEFHGTHNFRLYGACVDAFEEGGLNLVMLRSGHESEGCAMHYAKSELERTDKVRFNQMKVSDRANAIRSLVAKAAAVANKAVLHRDPSAIPRFSLLIPPLVHLPHPQVTKVTPSGGAICLAPNSSLRRQREEATTNQPLPTQSTQQSIHSANKFTHFSLSHSQGVQPVVFSKFLSHWRPEWSPSTITVKSKHGITREVVAYTFR